MQIVKDEGLNNARLSFEAGYFEDEKCEVASDFSSDVNEFIIDKDSIVFYAQSKRDSANQFESLTLTIEDLENGGTFLNPEE